MDYETAKDWELNVAVAKALGYDAMPVRFHEAAVATVYIKNGVPRAGLNQKDYCNNPSDAWPIIVENRIGFYATENKWRSSGCEWDTVVYSAYDAKPLRAAMIVFLKMKGAE